MIPVLLLSGLRDLSPDHLLGQKGLEKESLRLTVAGRLAKTPHPQALGAALTHPYLTTDYSEALLELITPPEQDPEKLLVFLDLLHRAVYHVLPEGELLLATSMPVGFEKNEEIPIARYGTSHLGLLKHIYRVGLDHRYGRAMQIIAGVHFNFSLSEKLWSPLKTFFPEFQNLPERDFRSALYLGQVRNLYRFGWLLLYLFGASPAVDATFLRCRGMEPPMLEKLDGETFYAPYGTSLRMSEIGYRSSVQARLEVDLNSLEGYIESLWQATQTPCDEYEKIGLREGDRYLQLSTALLQIENELYSPIRPKASPKGEERLLCRLAKEGVSYVEIRALDLNPFLPLGIDREGLAFLELFALYALLVPSPPMSPEELQQLEANFLEVAWRGRHPQCLLWREGKRVSLQTWAEEILSTMEPLAELLDRAVSGSLYRSSLTFCHHLLKRPEETPSARLLDGLKSRRVSLREFALERSLHHAAFFRERGLSAEELAWLECCRDLSYERQSLLEEESRKLSFEQFLTHYLKEPCHDA